jgi:hypothetical protein
MVSVEKFEAVNRRTDNTMTTRKTTKGQTIKYKTLHRKLKIKQHESHKIRELTCVFQKVKHQQI